MSGSATPTQLSLKWLRKRGYTAVTVEKWNPYVNIRQDLFGFIDILALKEGETLAVQTTSASNAPTRVNKIKASAMFPVVKSAGWRVVVHGWEKKNNRWVMQRDIELHETPRLEVVES